jgi:phosphoglycerol transferase MdoB-like AlkP superfamily enzyme
LWGNAGFNNFEGLLKNIDGLQMHTEGSFTAQPANVWGISDKDLFFEANKVFREEKKPFFAIVQTAYNHRPYMIPAADSDFVKKTVPPEELLKYGFESEDEYNTFRYSDYSFQKFMEKAQQEAYFHNTIFVFIGDHGVAGNATEMYPPVWTSARLTDEHVPFLIYAPYLLQPMRRSEVVSQIDVLPTIAGLIQQPYVNTTLGRNVLDTSRKNHFAFITTTAGTIGLVTDEFYFTKNLNYPQEQLFHMTASPFNYSQSQLDSVKKRLSEQTTAIFETARYMLMNNKDY